MRRETIALHYGYTADGRTPTTAVPIYQTAAYEFESAEQTLGFVLSLFALLLGNAVRNDPGAGL